MNELDGRKIGVKYIGDPVPLPPYGYIGGILSDNPGPHMICDLHGKGLKWNEVKHGMHVKIKARNVNHANSTFPPS